MGPLGPAPSPQPNSILIVEHVVDAPRVIPNSGMGRTTTHGHCSAVAFCVLVALLCSCEPAAATASTNASAVNATGEALYVPWAQPPQPRLRWPRAPRANGWQDCPVPADSGRPRGTRPAPRGAPVPAPAPNVLFDNHCSPPARIAVAAANLATCKDFFSSKRVALSACAEGLLLVAGTANATCPAQCKGLLKVPVLPPPPPPSKCGAARLPTSLPGSPRQGSLPVLYLCVLDRPARPASLPLHAGAARGMLQLHLPAPGVPGPLGQRYDIVSVAVQMSQFYDQLLSNQILLEQAVASHPLAHSFRRSSSAAATSAGRCSAPMAAAASRSMVRRSTRLHCRFSALILDLLLVQCSCSLLPSRGPPSPLLQSCPAWGCSC